LTAAVPEADRTCPRCGAQYALTQEYCLECGLRLPAATGAIAVLGSAWRRRLGWYPGDWVWPALLAFVLAAVAGVVSALWLTDTSSSATETIVATSPAATSIARTATAPPEPTTTQPTTTATGTSRLKAPGSARGPIRLTTWPASKSGWTVVLDSVPVSNGRAGALAQARQAGQLGLKDVGVIDSGQFSSLHPGYYVIFAGIYATQAEAQSAIIDAHQKGYRGPYPRRIVP
jgi:hypothetical protein